MNVGSLTVKYKNARIFAVITTKQFLYLFGQTLCTGWIRPWLLVRLCPKDFQSACKNFGRAHHIGYPMRRELSKSWTYLQEGWNTYARTPVTEAIEAAITGDDSAISAEFHLFGSCLKKKKKQKSKKTASVSSSVKLALPESLDDNCHRIGALVNHFVKNKKEPSLLYEDVQHIPSHRERDHLTEKLGELLTDPKIKHLSSKQILDQHVKKADAFAHYTGVEWDKWFIQELDLIRLQQSSSPFPVTSAKPGHTNNTSEVKKQLTQMGLTDSDIICFVAELCRLAGPGTRAFDIIEQWYKVLTACSSHWCRPTLLWCVGSTLVMYNVDGVTRSSEGGVTAPATNIENWDMLAILRLLQCSIFSETVRKAVHKVNENTRRDIAHEHFDCEWRHSCQCLVELLQALGCRRRAEELEKWCESKAYTDHGGEGHVLMHTCYIMIIVR